jgi:hypothetical protein
MISPKRRILVLKPNTKIRYYLIMSIAESIMGIRTRHGDGVHIGAKAALFTKGAAHSELSVLYYGQDWGRYAIFLTTRYVQLLGSPAGWRSENIEGAK